MPGGAGHLLPLCGEGDWCVFGERDPGVGRPGAGGAEAAGFGRAILGVDGDGTGARALGEDGGGQSEGSAADHRDVGLRRFAAGEREVEGDLAGAPGERPAGAAVAVVVDHELVANLFGFDARTLRAEGPGADRDLEEAIFVGADGGQRRDFIPEGERGCGGLFQNAGSGHLSPQKQNKGA